MLALVALTAVVIVVFRAMDPPTRVRFADVARDGAVQAWREIRRVKPECREFGDALRARTRWPWVTPLLVVLNLTALILIFGDGAALGDATTAARWSNFWLRTRNGEWWRLFTAMFVHRGLVHLLFDMAGLLQIGLLLERFVGRAIVATVFLTAGVFANLINLATEPMATSVGSSGGVFGLYGLLLASLIWTLRHHAQIRIPGAAVTRLLPAAALFVAYNLFDDSLGTAAEITALLVGIVCGAFLAPHVGDRKPAARRAVYATAAAIVSSVVCAIPLRGVTDIKPELQRTVAAEADATKIYEEAGGRFRNGRLTADALAALIEGTIIPELQVTGDRLLALESIPEEHQPLVADALEYVRLRSASWRLRAESLRKSGRAVPRGGESAAYRATNRAIAQAEETEREALERLDRIKSRPPVE
jgi:membrane associated rhomboid family serine protease